MHSVKKFLFKQGAYVVVALLVGTTSVFAATNISTNIQTDGTLSVTGVSTLTGATSIYGTASFGGTATSTFSSAGALTLATPLTPGNGGTGLSSASDGALLFGGIGGGASNLSTLATSTSGSVLQLSFATGRPTWVATSTLGLSSGGASLSTANVWTALQQFNGSASSTLFSANQASFGGTATSTFSSAGALTLVTPLAVTSGGTGVTTATGSGSAVLSASPTFTGTPIFANATLSGLASTTQLKVGNDQISTISGLIFGSCTLVAVSVTATSTAYTTCTGAAGVTGSYTVFIQNPSTLPAGLIVDAASSTAITGTLGVRINNVDAGATITSGTGVLNFWAAR